jgi:hypothetical protein
MPIVHDDPRIEKVGFAKVVGEGIELYSKKYDILIGRRSKTTTVDVVLGEYV